MRYRASTGAAQGCDDPNFVGPNGTRAHLHGNAPLRGHLRSLNQGSRREGLDLGPHADPLVDVAANEELDVVLPDEGAKNASANWSVGKREPLEKVDLSVDADDRPVKVTHVWPGCEQQNGGNARLSKTGATKQFDGVRRDGTTKPSRPLFDTLAHLGNRKSLRVPKIADVPKEAGVTVLRPWCPELIEEYP